MHVKRANWMRLLLLCVAILCFGTFEQACYHTDESPEKANIGQQANAIINGAPDLDQPAIGALVIKGQGHFCTGTLITLQLVVTAAHCVDAVNRYGMSNVQFRVDFKDPNKKFVSDHYDLLQVAKHPKYTSGSGADYDIAVLVLKTKAKNVTTIPINRVAMDPKWVGTTVRVVGYGQIQTQPQPKSADQKYGADIPLYQINNRSFIHYDDKTPVAQRKSACHGDSGGPSLYKVNGKLRVLGVTSIAYRATGAGNGQTLCDGGAVSTRTDTALDFLRTFLLRYGDGPEPCAVDSECAPCGTCDTQKKVCAPKLVPEEKTTCQPCKSDADCGGGVCHRFSTGFRCLQPCTTDTCCPNGSACATVGTSKTTQACVPLDGVCPDVKCTADTDCGPGETCKNSVCTVEPPKPIAQLCQPCHTSEQCGAGNYCYEGSSPLGYCVQACSLGQFCPKGFSCQQIAAGIEQCIPTSGCFVSCDANTTCPTGSSCQSGICKHDTGAKEGESCNKEVTCEQGLECVSDGTVGRCARACGAGPGEAGSPCDNGKCNAGLRCINFGGGYTACLEVCTGQCGAAGGICSQLGRSLRACMCQSDSDCASGYSCNRSGFGFYGACAPAPKAGSCHPSLTCRDIATRGNYCLPPENQGEQTAGSQCSYHTTCRNGLTCLAIAQDQPAVCLESCGGPGSFCSQGGQCTQLGRSSYFCMCSTNQQCPDGTYCHELVQSGGTTYGTCRATKDLKCTKDYQCPAEYSCQSGVCVFDTTKKRKPYPKFVPPDGSTNTEPATEPSVEPVKDASVQPEPTIEPQPEVKVEPQPEAKAEPKPEAKADTKGASDLDVTLSGGCQGCNTQQGQAPLAPWPMMLMMVFGLFAITRRKR